MTAATPRAFLTGANGFIGPHVISALKAKGFDVVTSETNLKDHARLLSELKSGTWDLIFHLAGMSLPADCAKNPSAAYETNFTGAIDFAKLCAESGFRGLFVFFSSAYVYDPALNGTLTEQSSVKPTTVYGRSKWFAEEALRDMAPTLGFPILTLRLFNHSHKSQRSDFFLPAMYRTLVTAQTSGTATRAVDVPMGNPNLSRDFSSMRDFKLVIESVAKNSQSIAQTISSSQNFFKVCNLSSGQARELGALVHALAGAMGLQANLKPQADRMRPGEPEKISGDPAELQKLLGFSWPEKTDQEFVELFLQDLD